MQLERTPQVWGISGNLGGGKTLSAVQIAISALRDGYAVVTNIALKDPPNPELVYEIDLGDSDPNTWPIGDVRGQGQRVMVILDEVAEWFDQYSATSKTVKTFLSWLRHSSKRGQDVFLVVQRREYLAKSLRILVARWLWTADLASWRIPKLRIRVPFMGGFIVRTCYDRQGNPVQQTDFLNKARWGRYYETGQILAGTLGEKYTPIQRKRRHRDLTPWILGAYILSRMV